MIDTRVQISRGMARWAMAMVSGNAFKILIRIFDHTYQWKRDGLAYGAPFAVSLNQFIEGTETHGSVGMSKRSVQDAITELVKKGVVLKFPLVKGGGIAYQLHPDFIADMLKTPRKQSELKPGFKVSKKTMAKSATPYGENCHSYSKNCHHKRIERERIEKEDRTASASGSAGEILESIQRKQKAKRKNRLAALITRTDVYTQAKLVKLWRSLYLREYEELPGMKEKDGPILGNIAKFMRRMKREPQLGRILSWYFREYEHIVHNRFSTMRSVPARPEVRFTVSMFDGIEGYYRDYQAKKNEVALPEREQRIRQLRKEHAITQRHAEELVDEEMAGEKKVDKALASERKAHRMMLEAARLKTEAQKIVAGAGKKKLKPGFKVKTRFSQADIDRHQRELEATPATLPDYDDL